MSVHHHGYYNLELYPLIMELYDPVHIACTEKILKELPYIFAIMQFSKNLSDNHHVSFPLTQWYRNPLHNNLYLAIFVLVDLDDPTIYSLRVVEGSMWPNNVIFETDCSIDIYTDPISVKKALIHIINGTIPLLNKNQIIDYAKHSYIVKDQ